MTKKFRSKSSPRHSYRSNDSIGYERARQHIEDAKKLSRELGGTDVDVKKYFFSMSSHELDAIFSEYGNKFGTEAEDYARKTLPQWHRGTVKMSGSVAERLFKILPPHMPIGAKYKLTESLWSHFGPSSKKRLRIGINSNIESTCEEIEKHISQVVTAYQIPKELEARFEWLSQGDIGAKQQLLNHLRALECKLVADGARLQLPVMIEHLKSGAGNLTHRMAQTLKIGKHELELLIDREFDGIKLEDWQDTIMQKNNLSSKGKSSKKFWLYSIIALVIIFILTKR